MVNVVPVNITANVGVASGAPNDAENTATYLTQLQQSLNGFTGSAAQALNYLLGVVAATPVQKYFSVHFVFGQFSGSYPMPDPNNPTALSGYTVAGQANNASGTARAVFTPAVTGRVALIGFYAWKPSFTNPGNSGSCNAILQLGAGSLGGAQGSAANPANQVGYGSVASVTNGDTNSFGPFYMMPMALVSGLSKTTTYWADCGFSCNINTSGQGGTILADGFLVVIEC